MESFFYPGYAAPHSCDTSPKAVMCVGQTAEPAESKWTDRPTDAHRSDTENSTSSANAAVKHCLYWWHSGEQTSNTWDSYWWFPKVNTVFRKNIIHVCWIIDDEYSGLYILIALLCYPQHTKRRNHTLSQCHTSAKTKTKQHLAFLKIYLSFSRSWKLINTEKIWLYMECTNFPANKWAITY